MAVAPSASAKAGPIHLAIGALGLRDAERDNQFADLLAVQLSSAGGFELVERQSLDKALREAEMTLSGLTRGTNVIRVGALTRADWFLLGTPTVVGGTNSVFLRIVDARSGRILRVQIFPETLSSPALAEKAAAFVIQSRELSQRGVPQVYLAVGTFQDVGLNNRFATFPAQIRSYLTAAYEGSQITVLERESVEPLLKEMQLDLAGLTAESAAGSPKIDVAFWLVDGFYQSYEIAGPEVDLVLRIERISGGTRMVPLREKPGEELLRHAKEAVDAVLAKNAEQMTATPNENFQKGGDVQPGVVAGPRAVVAVAQISFANQPGPATNKSEIDLQMARGQHLLGTDFAMSGWWAPTVTGWLGGMSVVDPVKRRQNVEGALHAFETVLLLDPDNRLAKMYVATCLRFRPIADLETARSYYRDLIASNVKDGLTEQARAALASTYTKNDPQKLLEPDLKILMMASPSVPLPDPDTAMFAKIEEVAVQAGKGDGVPVFDFGPVQNVYRDPLPTQKHIEELLPKLKAKFPELTPYLLYQAHRYQAESNSAVMKEFGENLDWCVNNPEKVYHGRSYFSELFWRWDFNQGFFDVAAHIASVRQQAMKKEWSAPLDPPRRVEMAYVYMAVNRWKDALDIFESFGNRVVNAGNLSEGPWGSPFDPFIPARAADECRKHLGIAPSRDEVRFELRTGVARSEHSFAFTPDGDSAWVAVRRKLYVCRSTEKFDREIPLPLTGNADVTCMAMGAGKIWIGTAGEGLVEYDIASGTARKFTETDGLALNSVSSLFLRKDSLWIGFGNGLRATSPQWGGVG
ncbi:MAG TPA: CsgG/HfaB family protein, partial [Verrucomicrobiae bacterium]